MYEKRMIILTGERGEKGTIKVERHARGLFAQINVSNVEENDYMLAVVGDDGRYDYALGLLPSEAVIELDERIVISNVHFVVYERNGEAVLYGTLLQNRMWWGNLPNGRRVDEKKADNLETVKSATATFEYTRGDEAKKLTFLPQDIFPSDGEYDDNAVSTENYYEKEGERWEKTIESVVANGNDEEMQPIEIKKESIRGRRATFYENHAKEIERVLNSYERVKRLEEQLPDTKWVKIVHSDSKYYLFGVVGKTPDYLCYGVPAYLSKKQGNEPIKDAVFLPLDPLKPQGEGYWLTYQDANTGKSIRGETEQ